MAKKIRKMVVVRGVRYRYDDAEALGLLEQVDDQQAVASTLDASTDPADGSQGETSTEDPVLTTTAAAGDADTTADEDDTSSDDTGADKDADEKPAADEKPTDGEGESDGAGEPGRRRAARRRSK